MNDSTLAPIDQVDEGVRIGALAALHPPAYQICASNIESRTFA